MDLKKLLQKKMEKGDMLSPMDKDAHKAALLGLRKDATDLMKPDFDGLKKVTVASDSPQGLEEGLDTAKKMTGKSNSLMGDLFPEGMEKDDGMDTEGMEGLDHLKAEDGSDTQMSQEYPTLSEDECEMDLHSVEKKLQDLMKLREKLKS